MILDNYSEFFDQLPIPAAGTALAGDVIDLLDIRDVGGGHPIYWYAVIPTLAEGGTSLGLELVTSASAALTSPTVRATMPATPVAELAGGTLLGMLSVPIFAREFQRYLGVRTVVAGTFTGGTITSGLTLDPFSLHAYAGNPGAVA